ncbi:MAG: GFA family protein [Leptolyngbyaceae cyanobacterium]
MDVTGGCFCGRVKYRISGKLKDPRSCHCSQCRKAFNSQASAYAIVEPSDFMWTSGEELLTTYTGEQGFGLQFCKVCGSTLCGTCKGTIHGVTLGCVDGSPELDSVKHIYVGSKADWEVMPHGVQIFLEGEDVDA